MPLSSFLRINPFARLLVFYITGIILASLIRINDPLYLTIFGVIACMLLLALIWVARRPDYLTDPFCGIISAMLLMLCGAIVFEIHFFYGSRIEETSGLSGTFCIEITEPPDETAKSIRSIARIKDVYPAQPDNRVHQNILVYFEKDSMSASLVPGEHIICKTRLAKISGPFNPEEFDYRKYLAARKIYNQIYIPAGLWHKAGRIKHVSVKAVSFRIQRKLLEKYRQIGLNNTYYSILSALTLGYRSDIESHTKQIFSKAGVMHVMALSGFNVAVIAFALSYMLFFADRVKHGLYLKTILIILSIWLFAFITGLSPSVVRASVMISLVLTGKALNRNIKTSNILYASAFIILAISPSLLSDISFQLSFAAVFGIIVFYPALEKMFTLHNSLIRRIWQMFAVSCAAQFATLPLTLYYFHQFPVYFWLTNLYVVPLVSVIIYTAGIFLIFSFFHPLAALIGKLLGFLLHLLYNGVALVELLPLSVVEHISITDVQLVMLFAITGILAIYSLHHKSLYILFALSVMALVQITGLIHWHGPVKQEELLIGNVRGESAISITRGGRTLVITGGTINSEALNYSLGNYWLKNGTWGSISVKSFEDLFTQSGNDNPYFEFSGFSFLVMRDDKPFISKYGTIDYLIVTRTASKNARATLNKLVPGFVIIDSSVPRYLAEGWLAACNESHIGCWNINVQGAWILNRKSRNQPRRYLVLQ